MKIASVLAIAALLNNYSVEEVVAYRHSHDHQFQYYQVHPEKRPKEKKEDDSSFIQVGITGGDANDVAEMEAAGKAVESDPNDIEASEEEKALKFKGDVADLAAKAEANNAKAKKREAEKKAAEEQAKSDKIAADKAEVDAGLEFKRQQVRGEAAPLPAPKLPVPTKSNKDVDAKTEAVNEKEVAKEAEVAAASKKAVDAGEKAVKIEKQKADQKSFYTPDENWTVNMPDNMVAIQTKLDEIQSRKAKQAAEESDDSSDDEEMDLATESQINFARQQYREAHSMF